MLFNIDPKRKQWIFDAQNGTTRSAFNRRCLSIDRCNTREGTYVLLNNCQVADPHSLCQEKKSAIEIWYTLSYICFRDGWKMVSNIKVTSNKERLLIH